MDNRLHYFNRMNIVPRLPAPRPAPSHLRSLEEQLFVLRALLIVSVLYLASLCLAESGVGALPGGQGLPGSPAVSFLRPAAIGSLLFWVGAGFLAARLWWPAFFCGLAGLGLSALDALPHIESGDPAELLKLAAMMVLVGAACAGGVRSQPDWS
jgi:hypothetical protein